MQVESNVVKSKIYSPELPPGLEAIDPHRTAMIVHGTEKFVDP